MRWRPGRRWRARGRPPDDFARQAAAVPLGHGPTAEEIAEAVVYLASARSVTGATLVIDGGQHLAWQTPDAITKE